MKTNPDSEAGRKRHHSFDGIEEYDSKLPNWWLKTLYGTILFSIAYWFLNYQHPHDASDQQRVDAVVAQIRASKLASPTGDADDATFWSMSRDPVFVLAGEKTYASMCASCHAENLTGRIGPNLVDRTWLHGGRPTQILHTITLGVAVKGMPTWGPILGQKKISELVAFIVSKHEHSEPEMSELASAATGPRAP